MSVKVENLEQANTVKLTIEVPAEELAKAMKASYNRQKKDISYPGFRKGKVPMAMVEKVYGPEVFYDDAANDLINQTYAAAAKESEQDIVSRPIIDVVQIEKGKAFIYTAEVAIRPEVTLGQYKDVVVTEIDTTATEEEIQKEIDQELENNARIVAVEDRAIENGDTAVIDFEGFVDGVAFEGGKGENHSLEIGSGSFIPGFEEQLIGKNAGESVVVNVTFPEDYHAEDLAGKAAEFQVKINEVKTKEIPELDDDFAQDVSEFDTVEEYKDSLKAKVEGRKADAAKSAQQEEAMQAIIDASEMEIPDAMIDTRVDNMIDQFSQQMASQGISMDLYMQYTGSNLDELREQIRPEAVKQIQSDLVLGAIAKAEDIQISDEDVEADIQRMAEMYKMEADKLKEYMGEEQINNMKEDLALQKALELIMDSVKPEKKEAAAEEE